MMRANFKATLLSIVRSPSLLFWPLAFPIILSLVFSMMFSGLEQAYRLQPVSVAVVRDANYDKATGFDELLSSVDDDGDEWHVFDVSSVGSVAEAERKVVDGDVSGYICLDADANPSLHLSPRASFSLGSGSLTSAQSVLDSYIRVRSEMEDLAKKDPMLLADPTVLQRFSSDAVSTERLSVTANDPKASVRYYYALLGMAAGIGSVLAMKAIRETQANATALGARRILAGFPRWRVLVSSTAAAWLASYACLAVGFAFIRFVLGVDFGGREGLALLALGAASLVSSSAGAIFGTFASDSGSGVLTAITCVLSFFAGLYGTYSQQLSDQVAHNLPLLAAANPIRQISQAFYSLIYYDSLEPFAAHCATLLVTALVLGSVAAVRMRRTSYVNL